MSEDDFYGKWGGWTFIGLMMLSGCITWGLFYLLFSGVSNG